MARKKNDEEFPENMLPESEASSSVESEDPEFDSLLSYHLDTSYAVNTAAEPENDESDTLQEPGDGNDTENSAEHDIEAAVDEPASVSQDFTEPEYSRQEEETTSPVEADEPSDTNTELPASTAEANHKKTIYELDINRLDRGLSEEERQEWNSIYASFRSKSLLNGTIIGIDQNVTVK